MALCLAATTFFAGVSLAEEKQSTALIGVTPEGQTCFIGGSLRGIIAEPDAIVQNLKHKDPYTLVRLNKTRGEVWAVGSPERIEDGGDCEASYLQDLTFTNDQLGLFQIALKGKPDEVRAKLPANFVRLPIKDEDYQKLLERHLTDKGLVNPKVAIKQLLAADIDGDGRQETFINAMNSARGDEKRGEYSIVLMRREIAGKEELIELRSSISMKDEKSPSLLVEHTIVTVMDVDGDGNAELIMYGAFAFGEGWEVLKIKGKSAEQVLVCGCG
ncbi:MAG: hypothetical protein HKN05_19025 [Rhizobiales bacterium]|nr:hypothetical protein [Hyphomicrobiales bacterium]